MLLQKEDSTHCHFVNRTTSGLNSELSFSETGCHTKFEDPTLRNNLLTAGRGRIVGFMPFQDYVKCRYLCPVFELASSIPFPMSLTATPRNLHIVSIKCLYFFAIKLSLIGDYSK